MEGKAEDSSPSDSKRQPILCEECKINPSKYKCPGCSLRSCSLPCVNSHKQRIACTGKRPVTNFVPISQFDDNILISDYNMLEDVKRIADSAQRMRFKLCGYSHFRLPFPLKSLKSAAASRRTKLLFLSNGMSKRQANRTYYNNRVHENTILSSVIENHLKPGPWNHKLRQFCDENLDSLKIFIRKYPKGQKSPYRQLNIKAPIREQLADMMILEYPVIYVYLPSHSYDFDVLNDLYPHKVDAKQPTHHDYPSPKGVTFREEEIKDAGSLDPHISDLMNHAHQKMGAEKEPKESVRSPPGKWARSVSHSDTRIRTPECSSIKSCIEELVDIGEIDIEFEPGLMDMYPDFIAGSNPDDFLDFDGIIAEPKDLRGGEFLMEEELEEGEIA